MLATRFFRRFTISEILQKTWRLQARVQIDKIEENIFKVKKDRDFVYHTRPWSLNRALLILKEWPEDKTISEISFKMATFLIQIHGLPLIFLHEGTAESIGKQIGKLHEELIQNCVVGKRYLQIRMDIAVEIPIPAGFFKKREGNEEYWVQFKYERLSDFCYKCGAISHVTGCYVFENSVTITSANGIVAKLYGPWIRSEHNRNLLFINPLPLATWKPLSTILPIEK